MVAEDGFRRAQQNLISIGRLAEVLPDFTLAVSFLLVWINPNIFGKLDLLNIVLVLLVEFITIHAAGFLFETMFSRESDEWKIISFVLLSGLYGFIIWTFSQWAHTWWPLIGFGIFYGRRILAYFLDQLPDEGEEREAMLISWKASAGMFLAVMVPALLLPMPAFGFTQEITAGIHNAYPNYDWSQYPQNVLAFGVFYFTALGISGIFAHRWAGKIRSRLNAK